MEIKNQNLPKVSVIILNWNGWKDTIECLESLYQINYPNYNVIVVDNHSEDDSINKIKDYCNGKLKVESKFFKYKLENKPIKILEYFKDETEDSKLIDEFKKASYDINLILIKNNENYGFAEGNNIGIRFILKNLDSDYILLLNNDTVVNSTFLDDLIEVAENSSVGIVGSTIYYYSHPNKIQSAGAYFSWKKGKGNLLRANEIDDYKLWDSLQVDYVSGCCLLTKKDIFLKCGLLDPEYFAYWEEVDFCMRAKKEGFNVVHAPKSKVWHKVSSSSKKIKGLYGYYISRNMFLFMHKNASKIQFFSFLLYFIGFNFWFMSSLFLLYEKDFSGFKNFLKGINDGLFRVK